MNTIIREHNLRRPRFGAAEAGHMIGSAAASLVQSSTVSTG